MAGTTGQQTSIALTPQGEPRIAYYSTTGALLKLARRAGSSWTYDVVSSGQGGQPAPSVAVPASGVEVVAFQRQRQIGTNPGIPPTPIYTYDLAFAQRTRPDGGFEVDGGNFEDVGPTAGIQSSAAVDSAGMVHVLYYDPTNADLRHAFRCP